MNDANWGTVLPCPFCGKAPVVSIGHGLWGYTPDTARIECLNCKIKMDEDVEFWKQGKGTWRDEQRGVDAVKRRWQGYRAHPQLAKED